MNKTFLILGVELRQAWTAAVTANSRSARLKKIGKTLLGYGVSLVLAAAIGVGSYKLTAATTPALAEYPEVIRLVWVNLLSAISMAVFIMLLMAGVTVVYNTLFEAGDLRFLLSSPVPVGSVVGAKLTVALVSNLATVLVFAYPVWIGFGIGSGAPATLYLTSLLSILFSVILFTALVSVFVMIVMRNVPSQKMKQLIMVGSLVVGFLIVVVSQLISAGMARSNSADFGILVQSAGKWGLDKTYYLPHVWAVKAALLPMREFGFTLWESLLPLAAAAVGAFAAAVKIGETTFVAGWSSNREVDTPGRGAARGRRKPKAADGMRPTGTIIGRREGQWWSVFSKDLVVTARQPVLWYGVMVSIVAAGFFLYNMSYGATTSSGSQVMFRDLILFMIIMLATIATAQLGGLLISMEGESLWLVKSAPIDPRVYYSAKLAMAAAPGCAIATLLLAALAFMEGIPQYPIFVSLPVAYAAISMLGAFEVMLDAAKPNFSIRLSGTAGTKKQNDPGKALLLVALSQLGTLLLGALFAFPGYYKEIPSLAAMNEALASTLAYSLYAMLIVCGHVVARNMSIANIKAFMNGRPTED